MRLVVVWTTVEDVQTHAVAAKPAGKAGPLACLHNLPELTRVVGTRCQMYLVVSRSPVKHIEAHVLATKECGQAVITIADRLHPPILPRHILRARKVGHVVLWAAIENVQGHPSSTKLSRETIVAVGIDRLRPRQRRTEQDEDHETGKADEMQHERDSNEDLID